jgi:hypothetical protein
MNEQDRLQEILVTMDVPPLRKNDWFWLNRNLGIRNKDNPLFPEASRILEDLCFQEAKGISEGYAPGQ